MKSSTKVLKSRAKPMKPRPFNHAGYELASISGAFFCHELKKKLPDVIYINCEELSVKKARKLAEWLNNACDYLEGK